MLIVFVFISNCKRFVKYSKKLFPWQAWSKLDPDLASVRPG